MKYKKIGDYLKFEFMEKFEVNQNGLALAIGVEQNRISEIIRGRRRITLNTDLRLCKFFGLEYGHFSNVQQDIELKKEFAEISDVLSKIVPCDNLK